MMNVNKNYCVNYFTINVSQGIVLYTLHSAVSHLHLSYNWGAGISYMNE